MSLLTEFDKLLSLCGDEEFKSHTSLEIFRKELERRDEYLEKVTLDIADIKERLMDLERGKRSMDFYRC